MQGLLEVAAGGGSLGHKAGQVQGLLKVAAGDGGLGLGKEQVQVDLELGEEQVNGDLRQHVPLSGGVVVYEVEALLHADLRRPNAAGSRTWQRRTWRASHL